MKLNTIVTATLLGSLLATSLSADFINYKRLEKIHVSASYGLQDSEYTDTTILNYEFGYSAYFDKYMFGANYVLEIPTDENALDYGSVELDLGYRVTPKATLYTLLAYDYTDNATAGGLGFGIGAKYQVVDYVAVVSKVKYSSMSPVVGDTYSKTVATVGLELNFLKR